MTDQPCPKTVAIIEDDIGIRDSIAEVLEDEGYRVVAADHGLDALDRLAREPEVPCVILLDFSRLVAGRVELSFEPIDLSAVLREVAQRFGDEAQKNKVRLELEAPRTLVGHWDASTLDQIITNLVSNAIKYGREHPVEIWAEEEGGTAKVVVRDHGIGIAAEDQERIFGRFERAVSSRNYGGFGLGLWIAQRGAESMGGHISVESALGQGAAFKLVLPTAPKEQP